MYKSKTILLLKVFTPSEIKRFSDFLNSPYYNTSTRVLRLYTELRKYYPDFVSRGVEKKSLYRKLFLGKSYNEQVMKNLIAELLKLEKEFLAVDSFGNNLYNKSLELADQLILRQAQPIFQKETQALMEILMEANLPLEKASLYKHLLEEKIFSHNIAHNKQSTASGNIEKSGEYLTVFFLKAILRLSANSHINRFSFNLDMENNFPDMLIKNIDMEKLLAYMESAGVEESQSLKIAYYGLVSVINVNDDAAYKNYHDMLYRNVMKLNKEDSFLFLHLMESICAQKINSGRREFYRELFDTYVYETAHDLYSFHTNRITVLKFRNIILCAIRVEEYQWAEKFINDFKSKLQREERKNIVELAAAHLNFARGDFSKSLEHLNKIKTNQIFLKIDVKNLNLMALYELKHYESALSLIESFKRMLVTSSSLTEQYSQKNVNFINSVNSLIKLKLENKSGEVEALNEKVEKFDVLSNKKWLCEKISEL